MQIIGFNFTSLSSEKKDEFEIGNSHRTGIEFLDVKKEEKSLIREKETLSVKYQYKLSYFFEEKKKEKITAEIVIEGNILFAAEKDEASNLLKGWKKKKIDPQIRIPLFNVILRRCSPKALFLEEELNLPSHIPMPQVKPGQSPEEKE